MGVHPMWDSYPKLKKDLAKVIELIDAHVKVKDPQIEKTVKQFIHSGGKMLRPAYTLLCSEIGSSQNKEQSIAVAASMECLHMATLIHDDVIDEADKRHGIPTIHTQHGNRYAIYTGDYLFCLCFNILAKHASSLANLEFNARGMEKILTGELEQLNSRYQPPTSVKNYLSRISGKTAQLFSLSCYTGALVSKAPAKIVSRAKNMGHYIGMAFQIMDDILDYQGESKAMGKPVLNDIRQGIYNLPLIYAVKENPKEILDILSKKADLDDQDMETLTEMIHKYKGIEKAKELAEKYTEKAIKELDRLPDGEYKQTLREITMTLLNRKM